MRFTAQSLRHAKRSELLLLANRYGFDGSSYTDKAIAAELITRQTQLIDIEHTAFDERVAQAQERIARLPQRLRELMPEGMRLGDYLQDYEPTTRQRQAPRPRIY